MIMSNYPARACAAGVKKVLRKVDSKMILERCSEKAPAVAH